MRDINYTCLMTSYIDIINLQGQLLPASINSEVYNDVALSIDITPNLLAILLRNLEF